MQLSTVNSGDSLHISDVDTSNALPAPSRTPANEKNEHFPVVWNSPCCPVTRRGVVTACGTDTQLSYAHDQLASSTAASGANPANRICERFFQTKLTCPDSAETLFCCRGSRGPDVGRRSCPTLELSNFQTMALEVKMGLLNIPNPHIPHGSSLERSSLRS